MKKIMIAMTAATLSILVYSSIATACEMDPSLKQAHASALKDQLLHQKFDGSPSEVVNGLMIVRMQNGQFAAIPKGSKFIIVDPILMDTSTGQVVNNDNFISQPPTVHTTVEPPSTPSGMSQGMTMPTSMKPLPVATNALVAPSVVAMPMTSELIGTGSMDVTVFVDPLCPSCHKFLSDLRYSDVPANITFHITPVSVISNDPANQKADELLSAPDSKYLERILRQDFPAQASRTGVQSEINNRNAYVSHGMRYVPAFILPDGTTFQHYKGMDNLIQTISEHHASGK